MNIIKTIRKFNKHLNLVKALANEKKLSHEELLIDDILKVISSRTIYRHGALKLAYNKLGSIDKVIEKCRFCELNGFDLYYYLGLNNIKE